MKKIKISIHAVMVTLIILGQHFKDKKNAKNEIPILIYPIFNTFLSSQFIKK